MIVFWGAELWVLLVLGFQVLNDVWELDERLGAILAKFNPNLSMDLFTQFFLHQSHCLRQTHIYSFHIKQRISALPDTLYTFCRFESPKRAEMTKVHPRSEECNATRRERMSRAVKLPHLQHT
jgi:hypothetical protein